MAIRRFAALAALAALGVWVIANRLTGDEPKAGEPAPPPKVAPKLLKPQRATLKVVAPPGAKAPASPTGVGPGDWAQWGGSPIKNNTPRGQNIPFEWNVGIDPRTGKFHPEKAQNIKWAAKLGSQSYGNPTIANGKVYAGTNNGSGYLPRYSATVDLGVLVAFNEADGKFLWQHSSEKLPSGRVNDWMQQGICCAPLIEGERLWFVSSRGEVLCLDTEGFHDGEDDGTVQNEWAKQFELVKPDDPAQDKVTPAIAELDQGKLPAIAREAFAKAKVSLPESVAPKAVAAGKKWAFAAKSDGGERKFELRAEGPKLVGYRQMTPADITEADVVWRVDMMKEWGVFQHNMCSCSVMAAGDILFVNTSNGVDESHVNIPAVGAPSFVAVDKHSGKVLWSDNSPGGNVLHGQWSSPSYAVLGGVPQVLFGGGDGWLYSFRGEATADGKPELLWKFDCNPKESKYVLGGRADRNHLIGTPVIYDELVYIGVGEDPEHAEGVGHLWCIDPTKRGDVSSELAFKVSDLTKPIPHRRLQAVIKEEGEVARPNPNSAAVWHYPGFDVNNDGKLAFEETMHRTCGTVAIKDDLLFVSDFSGLFHCLDAKTGQPHWVHDMLSETWGSPCIVEDKVYIGNANGEVLVFKLSKEKDILATNNMGGGVYGTPVVANNVLYINIHQYLFAITQDGK